MNTKRFAFTVTVLTFAVVGMARTVTFTPAQLLDKIKGGWAGQTIACTYGAPWEFAYHGTIMPDDKVIEWRPDIIQHYFKHNGGLYDDVYLELTFLDTFHRLGIDAPADSIACAFAYAPYPLWHANLAARTNYINGLRPPLTGAWQHNGHADDIDFQIEADFAGLMAPAMPRQAAYYADRVGHIMNSGDGYYGGLYVATMYSLAFVYDDIPTIVTKALRAIPAKSRFYHCMRMIIDHHRREPNDWKSAWHMVDKHFNDDRGCPDCSFTDFNIDAVINSAYVVIGLLYGNADFERTMEIATRCGQDADCNPATAVGILSTVKGYSQIPERYLSSMHMVEDQPFAFTKISPNMAYQWSYEQALEVIRRNGGRISDNAISIRANNPRPAAFEQCFPNCRTDRRVELKPCATDSMAAEATFEGVGFALRSALRHPDKTLTKLPLRIIVDGKTIGTARLKAYPRAYVDDRFWNITLPNGTHTIRIEADAPGCTLLPSHIITYKSTND